MVDDIAANFGVVGARSVQGDMHDGMEIGYLYPFQL